MENAEICLFYFSCIELLPPQYWGVIFVLVAVPIPFFRDFSKNDTYAIIFLVNFFLTKINEKLISFFATPRPLPPLTGGGLHPPSYKNGGQNTSYGPLFLFQKGVSLSPRLFPIISLNPYQNVNRRDIFQAPLKRDLLLFLNFLCISSPTIGRIFWFIGSKACPPESEGCLS